MSNSHILYSDSTNLASGVTGSNFGLLIPLEELLRDGMDNLERCSGGDPDPLDYLGKIAERKSKHIHRPVSFTIP